MPNRQQRRRAAAVARHAKKKPLRAAAPRAVRARRLGLSAPVEILPVRAAADGRAGPQRFRMTLYTGEPLDVWGFDHPVVIDCGSVDLSGQRVPSLLDHMDFADCVVGQVETQAVANGLPPLVVEGVFTPTDDPRDAARFVLAKARAGFTWQASVGGNAEKYDAVEAGQAVNVNGRSYAGPVYVARGFVLREASFVVLGADRHTSVVLARRQRASNRRVNIRGAAMDFETWLLSMGFDDPSALSDIQRANLQQMYDDEAGEGDLPTDPADTNAPPTNAAADPADPDPSAPPTNARGRRPAVRGGRRVVTDTQGRPAGDPVPDPVAAENRLLAANRQRVADIDRLCAAAGNPNLTLGTGAQARTVPLSAHAVEQGWTTERTELEALRLSRGPGPAVIMGGHARNCTLQAMQGAMILRAGGRLDSPHYATMQGRALLGRVAPWLLQPINDADRNRYMEAAHHYSQMSMVDVCRESIRLSGRDVPHDREDMIRAAFSGGGNLSNIFTTNVNAILVTTFLEAQDTTMGWVQEADVADYKTNERPRVKVGEGLKKVPRGAEADHTSFGDLVESYKIARFGRQFEIDEMDIVDDSFGVFTDTPQAFGRAAARLRPDLVYGAVMLANPTLTATGVAVFSDSNDNLQGTSALSAAKLSSGLAMMRLFRENSVNLNLEASHLIVPPTLEDLAIELTASPNILLAAAGVTDVTTIRGNVNSLNRRGLQVVAEARLENGVVNPADETTQAGSSSTWFLVCNYAPTIEVGYLQGTGRAPRVRTTVLDRGRWGLNWDVELSIGVKALEWRGFVKSTQ